MPWEIIYSFEFETWFAKLDQDSAKAIARSLFLWLKKFILII